MVACDSGDRKGVMPEEVQTSTGTENAGTTAPTTPASATPTTVTPAGTPAAVTPSRPATALDSLKKVASAASSAEGEVKPVVKTGETTQAAPQGSDPVWDSIPEARRNTILNNARVKEREAVTAEFESKYGWAKSVGKEEVSQAFSLARSIHSDPVAHVVQLISEIRQIPQLAAALNAKLGVSGGNGDSGVPATQFRSADGRFTMPKAKLLAEDGKTGAYTADQMAETLTAFEEYLSEKFGSRLAPVEEAHAAAAEREEVMNVIHASRQESNQLMAEMRALKYWPQGGTGSEGEKKISAYLAAIPPQVKQKIGVVASLYQAFNTYKEKDVYPTLQSSTERQVRDDQRRRVAASAGSVTPGTTVPQPATKKPSNVSELARHLESLAGGAS